MADRVAVVVACYLRVDGVRRLIEALSRQTFECFELIAVDQTGSGELSSLVESAPFAARYVTCIPEGGPAGTGGRPPSNASRARNAGVLATAAPFVAFTDDDCVPEPDWVERITAPLRQDPGVVMVTGVNDTAPTDVPESGHRCAGRQRPHLMFRQGGSSSLAVRRDVFLELGGFDTAIGPGTACFGAEDQHLIYRTLDWAGRHAAWVVAAPDAAVQDRVPDGRIERIRQIVMYFDCYGRMLRREWDRSADGTARAIYRGQVAEWSPWSSALRNFSFFWIAAIPLTRLALIVGWRRGRNLPAFVPELRGPDAVVE